MSKFPKTHIERKNGEQILRICNDENRFQVYFSNIGWHPMGIHGELTIEKYNDGNASTFLEWALKGYFE